MFTHEVRNFCCELASVIYGAGRHFVWTQNTIGNSDAVIVFSKSRGLVHDSRTICLCDICVNKHDEGLVLELRVFRTEGKK